VAALFLLLAAGNQLVSTVGHAESSALCQGLGALIMRIPIIIMVNPRLLNARVATIYCLGKGSLS